MVFICARLALIFYQKIYKADGDAHSWEWLSMVSPCVDVLRSLANHINTDLGASQGKKHTIPDLKKDIDMLMASLMKHEVYIVKEGRVLDFDEKPVPDVIFVGLASLTNGSSSNPLAEFNTAFNQVREHRRLTPVSQLGQLFEKLRVSLAALIPAPIQYSTSTPDTTKSTDAAPFETVTDDEDNASDSEGESFGDNDDEFMSGGPTLTRDDEDDIEFDMDTVVQYMGHGEYNWDEFLSSGLDSDSEVDIGEPETEDDDHGFASN